MLVSGPFPHCCHLVRKVVDNSTSTILLDALKQNFFQLLYDKDRQDVKADVIKQ